MSEENQNCTEGSQCSNEQAKQEQVSNESKPKNCTGTGDASTCTEETCCQEESTPTQESESSRVADEIAQGQSPETTAEVRRTDIVQESTTEVEATVDNTEAGEVTAKYIQDTLNDKLRNNS